MKTQTADTSWRATLESQPGSETTAESKPTAIELLPLYYKVLIINALVILLGAVIGTFSAWMLSGVIRFQPSTHFLLIGTTITTVAVINVMLLRYAFQPLNALKLVVREVRSGDTTARADAASYHDPDFAEFGLALNSMLGEIQANAATIEADKNRIRALTGKVISAQEQERKRIARELHDDTGQLLTALILRTERLSRMEGCSGDVQEQLLQLKSQAEQTLTEVRRIMLELRPAILDDLGLIPAVRWYLHERVEREGIAAKLEANDLEDDRLDPEIETAVFRIIQESLTNIIKYAKANQAAVTIEREGNLLTVRIKDDGKGFDTKEATERAAGTGSLGLFGMEERAALLGGRLEITSGDSGTIVQATIPLGATE